MILKSHWTLPSCFFDATGASQRHFGWCGWWPLASALEARAFCKYTIYIYTFLLGVYRGYIRACVSLIEEEEKMTSERGVVTPRLAIHPHPAVALFIAAAWGSCAASCTQARTHARAHTQAPAFRPAGGVRVRVTPTHHYSFVVTGVLLLDDVVKSFNNNKILHLTHHRGPFCRTRTLPTLKNPPVGIWWLILSGRCLGFRLRWGLEVEEERVGLSGY